MLVIGASDRLLKPGKQNVAEDSLKHLRKKMPPYKLKLKGFGRETRQNFDRSSPSDADLEWIADSEQLAEHADLISRDIYSLGALFVQIIFGVDLEKTDLRKSGSEINVTRSLETGSADLLLGLEPRFLLESSIVVMVVRMLDRDPSKRPQAQECRKIISQVLLDLSAIPSKGYKSGLKRVSISSALTEEGLWSGISSGFQQKGSLRLVPLMSSPFAGLHFLSTGVQPSNTNAPVTEIKNLQIRIPQERQIKQDISRRNRSQQTQERSPVMPKVKAAEGIGKNIRSALRSPPGALMQRLSICFEQKECMLSQMREKTVAAQIVTPRPKSSIPGVFLAGRSYFSNENQLKKIQIEKGDSTLDISCKDSPIKTSRNIVRTPNASTKPKFLQNGIETEALKQRRFSLICSTGSSFVPGNKRNPATCLPEAESNPL